jgi:hypothetical protein
MSTKKRNVDEQVSDCCLTPKWAIFRYIMQGLWEGSSAGTSVRDRESLQGPIALPKHILLRFSSSWTFVLNKINFLILILFHFTKCIVNVYWYCLLFPVSLEHSIHSKISCLRTLCEHIVYVPIQTVPLTIDVVSSNLHQPDQGEVYNIMW